MDREPGPVRIFGIDLQKQGLGGVTGFGIPTFLPGRAPGHEPGLRHRLAEPEIEGNFRALDRADVANILHRFHRGRGVVGRGHRGVGDLQFRVGVDADLELLAAAVLGFAEDNPVAARRLQIRDDRAESGIVQGPAHGNPTRDAVPVLRPDEKVRRRRNLAREPGLHDDAGSFLDFGVPRDHFDFPSRVRRISQDRQRRSVEGATEHGWENQGRQSQCREPDQGPESKPAGLLDFTFGGRRAPILVFAGVGHGIEDDPLLKVGKAAVVPGFLFRRRDQECVQIGMLVFNPPRDFPDRDLGIGPPAAEEKISGHHRDEGKNTQRQRPPPGEKKEREKNQGNQRRERPIPAPAPGPRQLLPGLDGRRKPLLQKGVKHSHSLSRNHRSANREFCGVKFPRDRL